jgi:hypothetical protein
MAKFFWTIPTRCGAGAHATSLEITSVIEFFLGTSGLPAHSG